jgi:four helix bundle protein
MHPYRKLSVWRKAHELTLRVHRATRGFTRDHASIAEQLRRASHSVPANIVEGSSRVTNAQFAHHLQIALASVRELDYFLLLASALAQISSKEHAVLEARADEIARMLVALRRTVVSRTEKAGAKRRRAPADSDELARR